MLLVLVGLAGSTWYSGPEVLKLMPEHGVHLLDLFVVGAGGLGVLALWWSEIPFLRRDNKRREAVDQRT